MDFPVSNEQVEIAQSYNRFNGTSLETNCVETNVYTFKLTIENRTNFWAEKMEN